MSLLIYHQNPQKDDDYSRQERPSAAPLLLPHSRALSSRQPQLWCTGNVSNMCLCVRWSVCLFVLFCRSRPSPTTADAQHAPVEKTTFDKIYRWPIYTRCAAGQRQLLSLLKWGSKHALPSFGRPLKELEHRGMQWPTKCHRGSTLSLSLTISSICPNGMK